MRSIKEESPDFAGSEFNADGLSGIFESEELTEEEESKEEEVADLESPSKQSFLKRQNTKVGLRQSELVLLLPKMS